MHPLAAPGALWVLSRAGKVPRPPAGGRNLSQEIDFLWKAKERTFISFFCFSGDFASAEATKGLSGRPLETFGAHPAEADGDRKKIDFLRKARERAFTFFSVSQEISPLRRRPKGFPVALWKPSGPTLLKRMGPQKNRSLAEGKGKSLYILFCFSGDFALCGGDQRAFRSPFGNLRSPLC